MERFLGKVLESTARCRGGENAARFMPQPWLDWTNYYATRDAGSRSTSENDHRGVRGALIDLEYERVELIKFNLFDNNGTFEAYVKGRSNRQGPTVQVWKQFRLPPGHPNYNDVGGADTQQLCKGNLIRGRTLTGICNDMRNPLMGSVGTLFSNNAQFETLFPEAGLDEIARNRHGQRLSLLIPDPQVISRTLFTRGGDDHGCAAGFGMPGLSKDANCDYKKASSMNVLAAFWIQFMTHDWFSHLDEGHNDAAYMNVGCVSQKVGGAEVPLTAQEAQRLGCRPADRIDRSFVADRGNPPTFKIDGGTDRLGRSPSTFQNRNTAWWDASQLYGYSEASRRRVKRDPADSARLLLGRLDGRVSEGDRQGYLPLLDASDPKLPDWTGQEAAGFPDNWTVGMSFYHNVFAREHNQFVDEFRRVAARTPNDDSGLRDPGRPGVVIRYRDVTPDELFDVARLVVSAEIAKIHTIEWTPQLLYNEPLFIGMNGNWSGLLHDHDTAVARTLDDVLQGLRQSPKSRHANGLYSALTSTLGIVGSGSRGKDWKFPDDANSGTNHFGSPFNFPEEFVSVYRLHPLMPDLIEYRDLANANVIASKIPIVETFRGKATPFMRERGLSNWAVSMGRQRLGRLTLANHPRFMQNLKIERLDSPTKQIDLAALDIIRDREHGVPRFNEFRRQYGLRQLTSFDDFIDQHEPEGSDERKEQVRLAGLLRQVYGQHRCDASKIITAAQLNPDQSRINDCLGHPNGSVVDNIEDVDTVVGYLAESTRPHGFAISETQFVVFILNASRRLFSDRFLTSSFRPEFYSRFGLDWVNNNGPTSATEPKPINGHADQPVPPLKRVLLRVAPELAAELGPVANTFDPWARDRGEYYSAAWKPRKGAEADEAFSRK